MGNPDGSDLKRLLYPEKALDPAKYDLPMCFLLLCPFHEAIPTPDAATTGCQGVPSRLASPMSGLVAYLPRTMWIGAHPFQGCIPQLPRSLHKFFKFAPGTFFGGVSEVNESLVRIYP